MRRTLSVILIIAGLAGCDFPGKPNPKDKFVYPQKVMDFSTLFAMNCAGCHGKNGTLGPAPPLADPLFFAIVSDDELTSAIAAGRKGTPMPAFAKKHGGTLTDEQVAALVKGMRESWSKPAPEKNDWPPYALPAEKGDVKRGQDVFARACATCHDPSGADPKRPLTAGFLALASEQMLRRIVITGRSDLGMPSCAGGEARPRDFTPLTAGNVNDVVALLMSWKQ